MTDRSPRQPASKEAPHAIPEDTAVLAAPRQRAMPRPAGSESKKRQRRLGQVPFGQTFSLHSLRCRLSGVVRELRRYSRSVRLPRSVRHRRTSLDSRCVPRQLLSWANWGSPGSRARCFRTCSGSVTARDSVAPRDIGAPHGAFRFLLQRPASRSEFLTRLYTRPAHSLVNASTPPSRAAPHDSGPMWVATSHSYDFFIHYTSPV